MTDSPDSPLSLKDTAQALETEKSLARAEAAIRDKRYGEADGICQDLLIAVPGLPGALALRASVAVLRGDPQQAIAFLEPAVAATPQAASWRSLLGEVYRTVYRLDEALVQAQEAIRLDSKRPESFINLAKILIDRGQTDQAVDFLFAALALAPQDPNAHLCLGQILLARGEFRPGWAEYEWRNQLEQAKGRFPGVSAPVWNGMVLPKARILLIADQGFGDCIQFARYIPLVAARCGEVLLTCSGELEALLAPMPGVTACYSRWADVPGFTAYALLSSLPGILGTDVETIPAPIPYLDPAPARVLKWESALNERARAGRRVGLYWSGRPTHPNDWRRSLSLADLAAVAEIPGISWISIQKEIPHRDYAALMQFPGLVDTSSELTDFAETAAVIAHLDLLITVDSAVAHLAGAMGKPVWVLMPTPADWRWQLDRSDSPWYPTMRLFRQPKPGAWGEVLATVAAALQA